MNGSVKSGSAAKQTRGERARDTRRRILAAARAEFVANGYHAARMATIAERANVSVQMLYFAFGTKAKLMSALIAVAVLGEGRVAPPDTEWYAALVGESTAAGVVRSFVLGSGEIFERAGPLLLSQRAGATTDPEIAADAAAGDALRAATYRDVIELAAAKGPLRHGLDIDAATDILVAIASPAMYTEFVSDRGWSHDRTIAWLAETLPQLICGDAQEHGAVCR